MIYGHHKGGQWVLALIALAVLITIAMLGWMYDIHIPELLQLGKQLIIDFGLLFLFLLGAFGVGAAILILIGYRELQRPEFILFAIAIGMGAIGHLTLLLGTLHLIYPISAWMVIGASSLTGLVILVHGRTFFLDVKSWVRLLKRTDWFSALLFGVLAIGWLYPLLADALTPPLSWDEVAYHLAIPKIYIQLNEIVYIPFIPYANWPLETEMLFTLSLLLPSETLTHLIGWAALVMISAGLYLLGRRYFGRQAGLLAAVLFTTTPVVGQIAGTALIELPLTLYTFLAIFTFMDWLDTNKRISWILSALFGGLAASTKLNGAMVPLILGMLIVAVAFLRRTSCREIVMQFIAYGLLAFAVVAPWYAKSWIQTGNPFWPFMHEILSGRNWDALGSEYLFGFIRQPNMPISFLNWLLGPWLLTIEPSLFGPPRMTLGWIYRLLIPLAIPAMFLLPAMPRQALRWLFILCIIFYTNWFFQTHQTRFYLPPLPLLAITAAGGVAWLLSIRSGVWRNVVQAGLLALLVGTSWIFHEADRTRIASAWPFLSGQLDRNSYIQSQEPGYSTYLYANEHLPSDAYVLLALYESRGYYLDRNYMWANPISQRALRLEQFTNADQLAAELHHQGFTHIFWRSDHLDRFMYIRFGPEITQLVQTLVAEHTRPIYQSSEIGLYELLP